ncbi:retrovirus-related pol polyprotein from transposon TNT 1-94 [Tanacetum coccineum]
MVADLRYFNSLEHEVDTLKSQLETQKTQFLNEIDRLSREYYYADHMNAILGVYTDLDEVTNLQCDYLETWEKCERLEKELSKSRTMSKSFEALQKHAINLELDLQQCKEKIKNDKSFKENQSNLVEIILFIVDSGCSKHMTRNLKLLTNFVEKFLGTVKFGNDQIAPILGYGDLVLVAQICIPFLCKTQQLPIHNLLIAKGRRPQAWLWHPEIRQRSSVVLLRAGKQKESSFTLRLLELKKTSYNIVHIDLCGPMRVESINGKKYVLVIVDDYSRYTWTHFLRSKDETPGVLIDFLTLVQRGLHAQVTTVELDKGTEFLIKLLHAYLQKRE